MSLFDRFPVSRPQRFAQASIVAAATCVFGALSGARPASATPAGPFTPFAGGFRGGGVVVGTNGNRERISCRANGSVGDRGRSLSERMVCASDSYRFDIHTHAQDEGRDVRGEWRETTRGVSGGFTGLASEGRISGNVAGNGFTAQFSLHAAGGRLVFILRPQGADVSSVEVALQR